MQRTFWHIATYVSSVLLLLFSILPATVYASTASSSSTQVYLRQWGSTGSSNGQFSEPTAVAVAPNGNIYVADNANNRIQEFTSTGTYVTQWGSYGTGNGQFQFPAQIAVASNGNVYVTDGGNSRVEEFTSTGTYVTQWGTSGGGGLAIASNGNVYVGGTFSSSHAVYEYSSTGSLITQWGSIGSPPGGNGSFDFPEFIAIAPNGNVYVTDSRGNIGDELVQEFTSSGTFVTDWTVPGANGSNPWPQGVAVDANGNVYVANNNTDVIQKYTSAGTLLSTFGGLGAGNGQLDQPIGIALDGNNDLYVVDSGNNRIEEFYLPQNLAFLTAPNSSSAVDVTLPTGSNITADTTSANVVADGDYSYPFGLTSLTFNTPNNQTGATVQVQITFQTSLKSSQVTPRMFNTTTKIYSAIPGATVTATTVNGQAALEITYSITDGGALDQDNAANGVIVDPIGLAVTPTAAAPNTGYGMPFQNSSLTIGIMTLSCAVICIGLSIRIHNRFDHLSK